MVMIEIIRVFLVLCPADYYYYLYLYYSTPPTSLPLLLLVLLNCFRVSFFLWHTQGSLLRSRRPEVVHRRGRPLQGADRILRQAHLGEG